MKLGDVVYYKSVSGSYIGYVIHVSVDMNYTINWWYEGRFSQKLIMPEREAHDVYVIGNSLGNYFTVEDIPVAGFVPDHGPRMGPDW